MKWHPFSEVVIDATSKFSKIKASDYHVQGKYKIIDQGKERIAGYTDDASLINTKLRPILVFGDHTRALKYLDEPIALGADGAKALWVNEELANPKYVYYYLRSIQIKEAGYSRHFKFLKEVEIPIPFKDGKPNLDEQIRIAHLLGKVEALIAQRKQHLQQLDDLLKSVFLKMFGDPVRNEMGWDIQPCDKAVFNISSGTSYGGEDRSFENPEELGVLKISAVTKGTFDPAEFKVVNRVQITKSLRFVKRGDFLFSRANTVELVAACCVVPQDHERLFLPDKIWVLTFNQELVTPQFFNYLLKNQRYRDVVRNLASGGHDSMLNISMKKFMTLDIPCPPIELQKKFTLIVEKVVSLKASYQKSLVDIEALYSALNQQAFKGRLNLSLIEMLNGQHARICDENDKME
jgi:type I restriction enzyme S subunit